MKKLIICMLAAAFCLALDAVAGPIGKAYDPLTGTETVKAMVERHDIATTFQVEVMPQIVTESNVFSPRSKIHLAGERPFYESSFTVDQKCNEEAYFEKQSQAKRLHRPLRRLSMIEGNSYTHRQNWRLYKQEVLIMSNASGVIPLLN